MDVQRAERAGFTAAMSSDHFSPWSTRQGESGFAWSFLGAALATTQLPFGVVNAPGQRYHPAIIAQAIATLAQMFPGRFWAALGSGEASNERVTGELWPRKEVRDQRLVECVDVIRRLLRGEEVNHDGLVHVNRARLWTLPDAVPDLVGPAVTPETAARHAAWADGLITVNQPKDTAQKVLDAYRERRRSWPGASADPPQLGAHGGRGHRRSRTTSGATTSSPRRCRWDLETVEAFDVIGETVSTEQVMQFGARSERPRLSTRRGCTSTSSRAGTSCTCTSSARSRRASSMHSASTCCRSWLRRLRGR